VAFLGDQKSQIETPSLCLDLSRFEANLQRAAAIIRTAGKSWRPHASSHHCPEIAIRQLHEGALGVTCGNVDDAEVFVSAGIGDIMIAHQPVGYRRIARIAALAKHANPMVTCDHYVQAQALSAECVKQGVQCRTLVELNVGRERTGVRPGRDALELASGIEKLPALKLCGIMGYEGNVMSVRDLDEKRRQIHAGMGILASTCDLYRKNGHCCDIVSASGTDSFQESVRCECLTEIRAGGVIFGDPYYTRMPDVDGLLPALSVLTTVVSRPGFDRAVLDAGRTAIAAELFPPTVKDWHDAKVVMHDAEHIVLELGPGSRELRIGDPVELIVGYATLTTMLHNEILGFRNNQLEQIWPIWGRRRLV